MLASVTTICWPVLISSTESATFRALGRSTTRPEDFGVDAMWCARRQTFGVQRKALKDLIASVDDGRLAKEALQMASLDHAFLILETGERGGGAPREMPGGQLAGLGKFGRPWTGPQLRGVLYGLSVRGIHVLTTRDEAETISRVVELEAWSRKARHESAKGRGSVPADVFGKRGNREYGVWLMCALPGVGVETAGKIWDRFGGVPVRMAEGVGLEELMSVPGVGRVTASRVLAVFGDGQREKGKVG